MITVIVIVGSFWFNFVFLSRLGLLSIVFRCIGRLSFAILIGLEYTHITLKLKIEVIIDDE